MAFNYDSTGGLFTRLGALMYEMEQVRAHQSNLTSLLGNVQGEYSSSDSKWIDDLAGNIERHIAEAGLVKLDLRRSAEKTLIEMCYAEGSASTTNTMKEKTVDAALQWLIRQMLLDSETIKRNVITFSGAGAGASNVGNGTLVVDVTPPSIMMSGSSQWQNIRKGLINARCVEDAQTRAISPGSERFRITTLAGYDVLDYRFPGGSGTVTDVTTICASVDDGIRGQNILTNGDLEDWTSNVPDQWTVSSGTAGTDFLRESTTFARGTYGLKAAVTGSGFKIRQQLGSTAGTLGQLLPDTQYVLTAMMRKDAGATGTINLQLEDGSGTAIGSAALAIVVSGLSSSAWTIQTVTFRTPKNLGSAVYVSLSTVSSPIATAAAYVDEIAVAELVPSGPGGEAFGIIAGTTNWVVDDLRYVLASNDYAGGIANAMDVMFDMWNRGLCLPSAVAGLETISDSLIA